MPSIYSIQQKNAGRKRPALTHRFLTYLDNTRSSTRRFFARPAASKLLATG